MSEPEVGSVWVNDARPGVTVVVSAHPEGGWRLRTHERNNWGGVDCTLEGNARTGPMLEGWRRVEEVRDGG